MVELLFEIITEGMYHESQGSLNHFLCCCLREEVSDADREVILAIGQI